MQIYKTENAELEDLDTARELDGTFNHEINNPLAAVLGNVELLLLDDSLDMETRNKLTSIRALSLRIRDVVREFAEINYLAPIKYNNRVEMVDVRR